MSALKRIGGHGWIVVVVVGLVLLAVHGLALRALFSRAALPIGAVAVIVALVVVKHLGLLAPALSKLRGHLKSKRG